ncbi:MAG TPA: MaoC family dehydratase N-terminal domain-containing protein [Acidimicrobiales bacterium]|nr:MaoC family dehydratase N-terminal domain-containing protein [Acidimicrobiales bacterium]
MATTDESVRTLDVSDLDNYMGVPMQPGRLKEPMTVSDIRRWAQGMHYPNPLHYDERWAAESRFGQIVAPQSFTVAADTSHGCAPANVGRIPDSHLIFGGDEWWFFGPRIVPGDHLLCHRMPYDYKVTETKFAGPTCFQRGDTLYINQQGERVALQRSTSIRYQVKKAHEHQMFTGDAEPEWTDEQLAELDVVKAGFIRQIHDLGHDPRPASAVGVGEALAPNALGPHSLASFTTEWRAYPMTTWGAMAKGPGLGRAEDLGYTPEMSGFEGDRAMERLNPELTDGAYYGPSRGHLQPRWARHVGMGRGYGYGASMGAWVLDYVAAWAGEWGWIVHSDAKYRNPAFTGDASLINGQVTGTRVERRNRHIATVAVEIANQAGAVMVKGTVDVELPAD